MLAGVVQRLVLSQDPDQPVFRIRTMDELVSESMARRRLSMVLLGIFAGVALALAAVGIYGIMSYTVARRSHEVGIRMALGAGGGEVMRLVLGQSVWLTFGGILVGLAGSLFLTKFLSSLLFNVKATDPMTFGVVALILMAVALLASFVPAYRATTVDPVNALRRISARAGSCPGCLVIRYSVVQLTQRPDTETD